MRALSFAEYERLSAGGGLVPVFREVPGDLWTPVSAFAALSARSERAFLLESVVGGERIARYSFLGRDPVLTIEAWGTRVVERRGSERREVDQPLLAALRARMGPPAAEVPGLPRFTGGAVGYLSYDAARLFESLPDRHAPSDAPLASFSFYRSLVAFDHVLQRIVLIADTEPGSRSAYDGAQAELDGLEAQLRRGAPARAAARTPAPALTLSDGEAYQQSVRRAQDHIGRGDIFQVVLSRQASAPCDLDPFDVYRALRMVNPSPYMYFL